MQVMKIKNLIFLLTIMLFAGTSFSQTIFWSDNFSAPAGGANFNNAGVGWALNSVGSEPTNGTLMLLPGKAAPVGEIYCIFHVPVFCARYWEASPLPCTMQLQQLTETRIHQIFQPLVEVT